MTKKDICNSVNTRKNSRKGIGWQNLYKVKTIVSYFLKGFTVLGNFKNA